MARDGSKLVKALAHHSAFLHQLPIRPAAIRYRPLRLHTWQQPFSTSTSASLPKYVPNHDNYPGFRNESAERRNVREHNLFDPQLLSTQTVYEPLTSSTSPGYATSPIRPPGTLPARRVPTSELERELLYLCSRSPSKPRIRNLLRHLLYDRLEAPSAAQYEALIFANMSPAYGSAENMHSLLQEMAQLGIPLNVNIYNAILRTLVIHPDVDLLNTVIESCTTQWIEVDSEMIHLICAAYLRSGMTEIALDYLESIERPGDEPSLGVAKSGMQHGQAELWLYVLFIQHLAEHNDWEGVMRLCHRLCDDTGLGIPLASRQLDIPYPFWLSLLEQAAEAKDRWVTFWIWEIWVLKAWIRPTPHTCMKVLEICAEHGAVRIAETVSTVLRCLSKEDDSYEQVATFEPLPRPATHVIQALLTKANDNAPQNEPRPSPTDIRRLTAEWWMFDVEDKSGLNATSANLKRSLRINPWAMLREDTDPGNAWARVVDKRDASSQKRQEGKALRKAQEHRRRVVAGRTAMRRSFPSQLLADIERAAAAPETDDEQLSVDVIVGGVDRKLDAVPAQDETGLVNSSKSQKAALDDSRTSRARIRLTCSGGQESNQDAEDRKRVDIGLYRTSTTEMAERKGSRVWKISNSIIGDERSKAELPKIVPPASIPSISLYKLDTATPAEQRQSDRLKLLAARRALERRRLKEKQAAAKKSKLPQTVTYDPKTRFERGLDRGLQDDTGGRRHISD